MASFYELLVGFGITLLEEEQDRVAIKVVGDEDVRGVIWLTVDYLRA